MLINPRIGKCGIIGFILPNVQNPTTLYYVTINCKLILIILNDSIHKRNKYGYIKSFGEGQS